MKHRTPQLERYYRHREEINAYRRAYRAAHRAEVNLKAKQYRETRKDEIAKYNREYAKGRIFVSKKLFIDLEKMISVSRATHTIISANVLQDVIYKYMPRPTEQGK
jgi:hypothetical protein